MHEENGESKMTDSRGIEVMGESFLIPISLIRPFPGQPRKHYDPTALEELAASLKQDGQMIPILVRALVPEEQTDGHLYELVGGERRWRACQRAGIPKIKASVIPINSGTNQFEISVIENCHREDLTLLETAHAVERLARAGKNTEQILTIFGRKTPNWVSQMRQLLTLDPRVLRFIGSETPPERRIPLTSIINLIGLPPEDQIGFAEMISIGGVSAIQISHLVRNKKAVRGIKFRDRCENRPLGILNRNLKKLNTQIEFLLGYEDRRIDLLFEGSSPDIIRQTLRLITDCENNFNIVHKSFTEAARRHLK